MATIESRLALVESLHTREMAIMSAKAADYSGGKDCNLNIKACERMGLCSAETGVMIRMLDKMQRVKNLLENEAKVKDESIQDTLIDLRNYAAILYHLIEEKKNGGE